MGNRKETKRFFLNMPWSVTLPLAAAIAVPFSIVAYRHPQQFADMVTGIAEAKWGGQFWAIIAVILMVLLVGTLTASQTERRHREDYIRRLEEECKKLLEKGGQE